MELPFQQVDLEIRKQRQNAGMLKIAPSIQEVNEEVSSIEAESKNMWNQLLGKLLRTMKQREA